MIDNMREIALRVQYAIQGIDKDRDIALFIQENRTGENVPEDIGFMPYNPSLGRAPVYGTGQSSTTKGALLGRRDFRTTDLENMAPERQIMVLESKIKELQIEATEIEKKKIDTELRISDAGPKDAFQRDNLRITVENQNMQLARLNENIQYYESLINRLNRGESIQPVPMATVDAPLSTVARLTSGSGADIESFAPTDATETTEAGMTSGTVVPPALSSAVATGEEPVPVTQKGEQDRPGVVDRLVSTIFHPREP